MGLFSKKPPMSEYEAFDDALGNTNPGRHKDSQQNIRRVLDLLPAIAARDVDKAFDALKGRLIEYSRGEMRVQVADAIRALQAREKEKNPKKMLDFMLWHLGADTKAMTKAEIVADMLPLIETVAPDMPVVALEAATEAIACADPGSPAEQALHALWLRLFATVAGVAPNGAWSSAVRVLRSTQRGTPRARMALGALNGLMAMSAPGVVADAGELTQALGASAGAGGDAGKDAQILPLPPSGPAPWVKQSAEHGGQTP